MQYGCNILENCSNMFNNFQILNFFINSFFKSKHFFKNKLIKKLKLYNLCCT